MRFGFQCEGCVSFRQIPDVDGLPYRQYGLPNEADAEYRRHRVVARLREYGMRVICTRDTDFHRFPRIEREDPLVAEP